MADAATTNRGLNDLLSSPVLRGDRTVILPMGARSDVPVFGDVSNKALFLDTTRSAAGFCQEADRVGLITLSDGNWHSIDWDPEVTAFVLVNDDASGTDGFVWTADPADNTGMPAVEAEKVTFYVADAPLGRIWVKRGGSNTITIKHAAYGSRKMLGASNNNVNVSHA